MNNETFFSNDKLFLEKILNKFCNIYKIDKSIIKNNDLFRFRFECFKYNYMIKYIKLPDISISSDFEAVLIEYRCFPHIEFLIRNAILKLGSKWCFTVVCGNKNYDFVKKICSNISNNIKIIKTNYDNLTQNEYSYFLSTLNFWNLFKGKKILIYQEDSFIFKSNIEEFIHWDYIGAPWPKNTNDTPNCVGNGGLSLRTKSIMIDIIKKIPINNTDINKSTKIYMKNQNLDFCPEDVYFSLNMQKYKIGNVANFDDAFKFSSESLNNPNSFGGHKFWLSDNLWIKRMQNNMGITKFLPKSNLNDFLIYTNKDIELNLTNIKTNAFDIDYNFYKISNSLDIKDKDISNHFLNNGMNGLFYHPKQLYNLFPNILIFNFLENMLVLNDNKIYLLKQFINHISNDKLFEYFNTLTINNIVDNF